MQYRCTKCSTLWDLKNNHYCPLCGYGTIGVTDEDIKNGNSNINLEEYDNGFIDRIKDVMTGVTTRGKGGEDDDVYY